MRTGADSRRAVENKRVFVIDADDTSGTALRFMLAGACETHVMVDVASALAKGRHWPPQLVLLGADTVANEGAAAVTRLRAQHPALKIMLVCHGAGQPGVAEALALGASSTLRPPLTVEAVRRKVDTQLARRAVPDIPARRSGA